MNTDKITIWQKLDENAERWLLLVFYVVIVLTVGVEVIRRFTLSYSSIWGEEVARYAFIYLAWIGAASAVKDRAHIRIDVILNFLPRNGKLLVYILGDVVMIGVSGLAFSYSVETLLVSIKFGSVTHGLGISQAWFIAAVPLGFSLMLFRLWQSLSRDIRALRNDSPIYTGKRLFD
ncbi:TRAP transporter small permease [Neptunomonas japonica]|uniref:TRAP transporter small permease n=1 Tax=Neptunomonas japonica TaxID=417574 RepID=UPI00041C39E4|nr:TRAP transporter small permease [Neptunomonas japonica]